MLEIVDSFQPRVRGSSKPVGYVLLQDRVQMYTDAQFIVGAA